MNKIKELQKKYNLSKDDFWNLTGNIWIIKHDAVERIAKIENVIFENPTIINSDRDYCHLFGTASIIKEGRKIKDDWSFGEADLKLNCKNKYVFAMAMKRLRDRLTLSLIDAYEYGIYSDTEADDFKKKSVAAKPTQSLPLNKSGNSWSKYQVQGKVEELI